MLIRAAIMVLGALAVAGVVLALILGGRKEKAASSSDPASRTASALSSSAASSSALASSREAASSMESSSGGESASNSSSTQASSAAASKTTSKTASKAASSASASRAPVAWDPVDTLYSDQWYLTVVSRNRPYPESYSPSLAYIPDGYRLDSRAAEWFNKMYDAAAIDGIYLSPISAFRNYALQKELYQKKVQGFLNQGYSQSKAEDLAAKDTLPPGTSEHGLGLAVDIASVETSFENTKTFAWLQKNAQDYGFILRYAKNKADITSIMYEPWHWRYVGVTEAPKIKASGLCLEEYLGLV